MPQQKFGPCAITFGFAGALLGATFRSCFLALVGRVEMGAEVEDGSVFLLMLPLLLLILAASALDGLTDGIDAAGRCHWIFLVDVSVEDGSSLDLPADEAVSSFKVFFVGNGLTPFHIADAMYTNSSSIFVAMACGQLNMPWGTGKWFARFGMCGEIFIENGRAAEVK